MAAMPASPPVRRGTWVARVMIAQMQNKKTELYGPLLEHPKLKKRGFGLVAVLTVRFKAADRRVISHFHARDDIVVRQ